MPFGKWLRTKQAAWGEIIVGAAVGYFLTLISPWVGVPIGVIAIVGGFYMMYRVSRRENTSTKEYVNKLIIDKKAESLLNLPEALQKLGECDIEMVNRLRGLKMSKSKLAAIQRSLQQNTKITPADAGKKYTEEEVRDAISSTVKKLDIKGELLDENTQVFMLKVAGVLDAHNVGISRLRFNDERFKSVNSLSTYIETKDLSLFVKTFKWSSLGINSILLSMYLFPPQQVQTIMNVVKKTHTELVVERDDSLSAILRGINQYIRIELSDGEGISRN